MGVSSTVSPVAADHPSAIAVAGSPMPYGFVFWSALVLTVVAHYIAARPRPRKCASHVSFPGSGGDTENPDAHDAESVECPRAMRDFEAFQRNYLAVYLLAVAADWLQGPYVYALYTHYGYSKADVGQLYIAGFASSAIFGTFVASIADKFGRKNNSLLYCATYMLSCATKHSGNFWMLFLGRLLGGVAYSILFSAFESWMVAEHTARAYRSFLLSSTFAKAQLCNGIVAIVAGKTAGWFADKYGKVMPFDISICVLIALGLLIQFSWTENYGDKSSSIGSGFRAAWRALWTDKKIMLIGVVQAAFEGAMYTFTFVWTPALQAAHEKSIGAIVRPLTTANFDASTILAGAKVEIPHGTVFSTFMAATMIGSSMFELFARWYSVEMIMRAILAIGSLLFVAPMIRNDIYVIYISFVAFEVLCGVYFPAMATMRTPYIPEENRSALLTFFRVPLNVIVVLTLYEDLTMFRVFMLCASLLFVGFVSQQILLQLSEASAHHRIKQSQYQVKKKEESTS